MGVRRPKFASSKGVIFTDLHLKCLDIDYLEIQLRNICQCEYYNFSSKRTHNNESIIKHRNVSYFFTTRNIFRVISSYIVFF